MAELRYLRHQSLFLRESQKQTRLLTRVMYNNIHSPAAHHLVVEIAYITLQSTDVGREEGAEDQQPQVEHRSTFRVPSRTASVWLAAITGHDMGRVRSNIPADASHR